MKKISKILSLFMCFAVVICLSFGLVGCDKEELKENAETVTETTIETATSIIPVEFTKETAKGIYTTALQNFLASKTYKIDYVGEERNGEILEGEEICLMKDDVGRFVYESQNETTSGYYDNKYCVLDMDAKTYTEESNSNIVCGNFGYNILIGINYVVSGRYYDGYNFVNVEIANENTTHSFEFKIKDDKFVEVNLVLFQKTESAGVVQTAKMTISYDDIDTSNVITSLDGYTKVTE